MEDVVVVEKGDQCTAPGCEEARETLDHRVPFANGGRTSVENLFPMCHDHNLSKQDSDYDDWVLRLAFGIG